MPQGIAVPPWLTSVTHSFLASYSDLEPQVNEVSTVATTASSLSVAAAYSYLVKLVHRFFRKQSLSTVLTATASTALCIYIFAPSLLPQTRMFSVFSSRSRRPGRYTVGLANMANDCFANSNLQALASLRSLLLYIDEAVMAGIPQENLLENSSKQQQLPVDAKGKPYLRLTRALGSMILELNEPVKVPKTISPWKFLVILEQIYNSRISRNQHDAHELLHLILECLSNEYELAVKDGILRSNNDQEIPEADIGVDISLTDNSPPPSDPEMLSSFPFEGSTIDRIACSRCGYLPSVQSTNFLVLSLMVPQKRNANLTDLIDRMTAPEYIKDYGCVSCRLKAITQDPSAYIGKRINGSTAKYTPELVEKLSGYSSNVDQLPEELEDLLPKNISSPISKSTRFSKLPMILSLHLSRSIYSGDNASRNSCKVSCPEFLELYESNPKVPSRESSPVADDDDSGMASRMAASLGSLKAKKRVKYRLVAMIRHNGTHYTGHYECYRRKNLTWWKGCIQRYSNRRGTTTEGETSVSPERLSATPEPSSMDASMPSPSLSASQPSSVPKAASTSYVTHSNSSSYSDLNSLNQVEGEGEDSQLVESLYSTLVLNNGNSTGSTNAGKYEWWRISDDSIWECHTKDVLKEESGAYLLFYEQCIES